MITELGIKCRVRRDRWSRSQRLEREKRRGLRKTKTTLGDGSAFMCSVMVGELELGALVEARLIDQGSPSSQSTTAVHGHSAGVHEEKQEGKKEKQWLIEGLQPWGGLYQQLGPVTALLSPKIGRCRTRVE